MLQICFRAVGELGKEPCLLDFKGPSAKLVGKHVVSLDMRTCDLEGVQLTGRAIVVNSVLLSNLWYFVAIWGGSLGVIKKIRVLVQNFLWSGSSCTCRVRVSWNDCCVDKCHGGLAGWRCWIRRTLCIA